MLVIANNQQVNALTSAMRTLLNTCTLKLFSNNLTPDPTDRAGDFTECTFTGYASQAMTGWAAPTQATDILSYMRDVVHSFVCTAGGGQNIYGYYVTLPSGDLFFSERYSAAPYAITAGAGFFVEPYFSTIQQT